MIHNWSYWYWKLGLTSCWVIAGTMAELSARVITSSGNDALAQVILKPISPGRSFLASTEISLNFKVDVGELIVQNCSTKSEFFITGRGGLPPTPREMLRIDPPLIDLGPPPTRAKLRHGERPTRGHPTENPSSSTIFSNPTTSPPTIITEAQGWLAGPSGEVVLTAQSHSVTTPHSSWMSSVACHKY